MRFMELFAGVGGFRVGLEKAGHQCVWANEWDKWAAKTYKANHGRNRGHQMLEGDIHKVEIKEIPDHDLLQLVFLARTSPLPANARALTAIRASYFGRLSELPRPKNRSGCCLKTCLAF